MIRDGFERGEMLRGLSCRVAPEQLAVEICQGVVVPDFRASICKFYPQADQWLTRKVLPGLMKTRRFLAIFDCNGEIQGVSIIKIDVEHKICSFWLSKNIRGRKIGSLFMHYCLSEIECSKPLLTVPHEISEGFSKLVANFNFTNDLILTDFYRQGSAEMFFNWRSHSSRNVVECRTKSIRSSFDKNFVMSRPKFECHPS